MQNLHTANPRIIKETETRGQYTMTRVRGLFMRSVDNHHVRTILYGLDMTEAKDRAHSRALAALQDTEALGRGSFAGDYGFHFRAYHYCEDTITALFYDRSLKIWHATVQRVISYGPYDRRSPVSITFNLALVK